MVVELSKSLGTKLLVSFFSILAAYFVCFVSFELSRSSVYYWSAFLMSAASAWLSLGETEITVLDKSKNTAHQEKKLPLCRKLVLVLGNMSDVVCAKVESDPALSHLQRLVLKFEDKSFPLTDTFLDTRRGLMHQGAGIEEVRRAINNFCRS